MVPVTYDESKGNPILSVIGNIDYVSINYYGDTTGGTVKYTNQIRSGFNNIPIVGNWDNETLEGNYRIAIKLRNGPSVTTWIKITKVAIADTTAPIITASDISLYVGKALDLKSGLKAVDDTDGDITDRVEIIGADSIDITKAGTYEVTYRVSDRAGNVTEKIINVIVESVIVANKALLQSAIKAEQDIGKEELDKVIPVVVNEFNEALAVAQDVYENAKATQAEIDDAYGELLRVYLDLRLKPSKDLLNGLINRS